MFLHVVGHNQRFRVVHQTFRKLIKTVSRIFHQVLYAVGELRADLIKPPSTATHPKIMGSHRWSSFIKVLVNQEHYFLVHTHVIILAYATCIISVELHWCH
jgi:hypothetical protein